MTGGLWGDDIAWRAIIHVADPDNGRKRTMMMVVISYLAIAG